MTIAALIISGLALAISIGTAAYVAHEANKRQRREWRYSVLRRLSGYRYRLTKPLMNKHFEDGEPFVALNEAKVVFGDSAEVRDALEHLRSNIDKNQLASDLTKVITAVGRIVDRRLVKDLTLADIENLFAPPVEPQANPQPQSNRKEL